MSMEFGKLDFAVSFNRLTAFPLDARSYFESYESASAAAATAKEAGSSESVYYFGQDVVVVENNVATKYVIQPDGTLKEVGGKVAINENVFTKDEDGSLNLLGFADAVAGAQLLKSADGKLSWVKPDNTTVEGLSTAVEGLRTDVDNLQTEVAKKANADDVYTKTAIDEALGKKANADNVYTKEETDTEIASQIANASHLSRVIATEDELAGFIADPSTAVDNVIYMQKVAVDGVDKYKEYMRFGSEGKYTFELTGDTSVDLSDYATIESVNTALESYAKSADVKTTTDALSERITANADNIATKAEATAVSALEETVAGHTTSLADLTTEVGKKASQTDLTALTEKVTKNTNDITALTTEVDKKASQADLTALTTTVGNKVDKKQDADGTEWTLLSPSDAAKLAKLVIGDDGLEISGKVSAGNVEGLADWITGQRDTVPGLLSAANETKLNGIAEGAQANVIEAIKLAGSADALVVTDKTVELPFATGTVAGIVKTSNEIGLNADNALEVKALNVSKLIQTEDVLLDCGNASAFKYE